MTKSEFISLLEEPGLIDETHLASLSQIVDTHPYFHAARMLQLKAFHTIGHLDYEKALTKTALSVPDRTMLYKIIMRPKLREQLAEATGVDTDTPALNVEMKVDALESDFLEELITATPVYDISKVFDPVEETTPEIEEEPLAIESSEMSFYDWLDADDEPNIQKVEHAKSPEDIIDAFIKAQPRIKARASDSYVPSDLSRLSLVDDSDFVTETLARIYIKQKNYDKAIEIYEKLSLTNPEKKGYFATQIHYLKDLDSKS